MVDDMKKTLVRGLTSSPKYIPTWYGYDDVGSKLQHKGCMDNLDYYFSRSQVSILKQSAQDIIPRVSHGIFLVDLGSGNCSTTRIFINELLKRQKTITFYPVDISGEFLLKAMKTLSGEYGDALVIHPIAEDYKKGIEQLKRVEGAKMILWLGSMIVLSYDDQVNTLRMLSSMMTDKCRLVFSVDITQDREAILKAYNDDAGAKRAFIQHGITRLNKEEGSQIDLQKFKYEVDYISDNNPKYMSYVRAYIQANEDVRYPIPGFGIDLVMETGERLFFHEGAGYSCKYTLEQVQSIIRKAGLHLEDTWMDEKRHAVFCRCKIP